MFSSLPQDFAQRVTALVRAIPPGKVATYGQIAALAGAPRHARMVGRILHRNSDPDLPWHRVINHRGAISLPRTGAYELQRQLLLSEGIVFGPGDRIDLARFGWKGPGAER